MEVPGSLKAEHEEIWNLLERAVAEQGAIGEAAKAVEERLRPHFEREEEFALPPLAALTLSGEEDVTDPEHLVRLTERLRDELPRMLEDHVLIAIALEDLSMEAKKAGRSEYIQLSEKLLHHARMEEEIFYPTALLIGSYIRQKMRQKV